MTEHYDVRNCPWEELEALHHEQSAESEVTSIVAMEVRAVAVVKQRANGEPVVETELVVHPIVIEEAKHKLEISEDEFPF